VDTETAPLKTGIELIDREHEHLLALEARLQPFCECERELCHACASPTREECDRTLSRHFGELLDYMVEHFRHEERLMDCLPREAARAHKFEHAEISDHFIKLIQFNKHTDMLVTPSELRSIVRDWLDRHIVEWDYPLAERLGAPPRST
jgi:hemerythrin-like metal-binding protein